MKPHKRKTIRLKGYDYSQQGMYFITICTYNRRPILSKIINKNVDENGMYLEDTKINLSEIGIIVENEILKTTIIRKNIKIINYVIMPNHIHMIISIINEGTLQCAPTIERFGKSVSNSISEIVRAIKGGTTRRLNKKIKSKEKIWQRNYYEHIIRSEKELYNIIEYIEYNPLNWKKDELYIEC